VCLRDHIVHLNLSFRREVNGRRDVARRVQPVCTKGKYLQELRVYLPQKIVPEPNIAKRVSDAPFAPEEATSCSGDTIAVEQPGLD
jgi:hypothetical protein